MNILNKKTRTTIFYIPMEHYAAVAPWASSEWLSYGIATIAIPDGPLTSYYMLKWAGCSVFRKTIEI